MLRFTVLVLGVGCVLCHFANGFPAPRPDQPPKIEELIAGEWQVVDQSTWAVSYEFAADGNTRMMGAGRPPICGKFTICQAPNGPGRMAVCMFFATEEDAVFQCRPLKSFSAFQLVFEMEDKTELILKRKIQ